MKTISYGTITINHTKEGTAMLTVFSPVDGVVTLEITPDELLMFMVEVSNGLTVSRDIEIKRQIERDILNETRKRSTRGRGSDATEGK